MVLGAEQADGRGKSSKIFPAVNPVNYNIDLPGICFHWYNTDKTFMGVKNFFLVGI